MSRCDCIGCGEHFVGVTAFDAHRVGGEAGYCYVHDPAATDGHPEKYTDSDCRYRANPARRCLTAAEMHGARWEPTAKGWRHPAGIVQATSVNARMRGRAGPKQAPAA